MVGHGMVIAFEKYGNDENCKKGLRGPAGGGGGIHNAHMIYVDWARGSRKGMSVRQSQPIRKTNKQKEPRNIFAPV